MNNKTTLIFVKFTKKCSEIKYMVNIGVKVRVLRVKRGKSDTKQKSFQPG